MSWWAIAFLAFLVFIGVSIVIGGIQEILAERKEPFLFEEGEKVIRIPAFDFQAHLIALSSTYCRYTVVERKRNWIGQKIYKTQYPTVEGFVWFREYKLIKNFNSSIR